VEISNWTVLTDRRFYPESFGAYLMKFFAVHSTKLLDSNKLLFRFRTLINFSSKVLDTVKVL
jgi:hypothetical protein